MKVWLTGIYYQSIFLWLKVHKWFKFSYLVGVNTCAHYCYIRLNYQVYIVVVILQEEKQMNIRREMEVVSEDLQQQFLTRIDDLGITTTYERRKRK